MLAAQIGADFVSSSVFYLLTRRVSFREQFSESMLVYGIDVALTPVGFLAALSIDESPWYLLLLSPMFGVLAVFAGERRTRMRQLTELNGAYRGTAIVLAEVVDADDAYTGMHTLDDAMTPTPACTRATSSSSAWPSRTASASTSAAGATSSSARCCTTSARWRSPRRSSTSPASSPTPSGRSCAPTRSRASGCSTASAASCAGSARSSAPRTSAGTAAATPTDSPARRSRSRPASRPYRNAMDPAAATAELTRCAGSQFDPLVVDALLAVIGAPAPAALRLAA
jgi:hypothetical protein